MTFWPPRPFDGVLDIWLGLDFGCRVLYELWLYAEWCTFETSRFTICNFSTNNWKFLEIRVKISEFANFGSQNCIFLGFFQWLVPKLQIVNLDVLIVHESAYYDTSNTFLHLKSSPSQVLSAILKGPGGQRSNQGQIQGHDIWNNIIYKCSMGHM